MTLNIVVNLSYTGATDQFSSLLASVTIPAGSHSATFTVMAKPTAADNSSVTLLLNDISYPANGFASVGSSKTATVSIKPILVLTSSATIPATCGLVQYSATGSAGTTITGWSRAAVAGVTPATGSGSGATINETLNNSSGSVKTVTYTFTLTNTNGCTNTQNVTVVLNPAPSVPSISGASDVCQGSSIVLSNTTAGGVWSSSNTAISTVNTSGQVTGVAAGTVTISYTVTGSGCSTKVDKAITVKPKPVLTSSLNPSAICSGTTFSYTHTSAY